MHGALFQDYIYICTFNFYAGQMICLGSSTTPKYRLAVVRLSASFQVELSSTHSSTVLTVVESGGKAKILS